MSRYEDGTVEGMTVDFHPLLTVLRGVPRDVRERIISTVSALPGGHPGPGRAVVESHGILLDNTEDDLKLLELAAEIDPVLRVDDLPRAELEQGTSDDDMAEARRRLRQCDARYEQVVKSVTELKGQRDRLVEERMHLGRQIESARGGLDTFAEAGLREARNQLASIRDAVEGIKAEEDKRSADENLRRELERELARLERERVGLVNGDPTEVRNALSALHRAMEPLRLPSNDALRLADQLAHAQRRLEMMPERGAFEYRLDEAERARSAARARQLAAERELRSPSLDPVLVDDLETNRDELIALETSRRVGPRSKRRALQLKDRELDLVERLGFASFGDYLLGVPVNAIQGESSRALEAAQVAVAEAEGVWRTIRYEADSHPVLAPLRQEIESLTDAARDLIGGDGDGDLVEALRSHTTLQSADPVAVDHAARAVTAELAAVGLELNHLDVEGVQAAAAEWLNGAADVPRRLAALNAAHEKLQRQLEELVAVTRPLAPAAHIGADLGTERQAAEARVGEHEARLDRHRAALTKLSELRVREELLRGHEADLERQLREQDRLTGVAAQSRQAAQADLSRIEMAMMERGSAISSSPVDDPLEAMEWYVLSRLAQQRAVSYAGSVPMVIDDAFAQWSFHEVEKVHDRLARMSEAVQIIYFSESDAVGHWAAARTEQRAKVVDFREQALASPPRR